MSVSPVVTKVKSVEVPTDVLDILDELDLGVRDVLVEVDGQPQLDDGRVEELRAQARTVIGASGASDEPEVEDGVGVNYSLADFDFGALVAGLPLIDPAGALEEILEWQAPYVAAATAAGTRNASAAFFDQINRPLFTERLRLREQVVAIERKALADRSAREQAQLRSARMNLERITDLIVRFNEGLTRKYVRLFTSNTSVEDSADFQSAAIVGLMGAIDTFDPKLGKFGSWAYKRVQREVLRAVREADYKSMNHGDFERRPEVLRAYHKLAGPNGENNPTFEQVAAEAGCTLGLVKRVLAAPHLESLHTMVGPDGDTELGELLPDKGPAVDDQVVSGMDVEALVLYGLPVLDAREHWVIARRFGLDGEKEQCLASIGKQLGLSREAVRQIEGKALARLLHPATLSRIVHHGRQF